jgi:hypothetical protein
MQSSPVRVRYCLRSIFSPLLLTGCLAEFSGSLPAASCLIAMGIVISFIILFRPFIEVDDGNAKYVGLLTGRRMPVEDVGVVISSRFLRWFVRRGDMEKLQQFFNGAT